jgi:hypothetical protein
MVAAGTADTLAPWIGPGKDPYLSHEFGHAAGDHDDVDGT